MHCILMHPSQLIEDLHCNGIPEGRVLTEQERTDIVEFAVRFEECNRTETELQAMTDKDLIATSYWFMAEYASGQI